MVSEKKTKKSTKKKEQKKDRRVGTHPKHPACPSCGRAMYKTMVKGKAVKREEPWAYCRNETCELYGLNQELQGSQIDSYAKDETKKVAKKETKKVAKKVAKKDVEKEAETKEAELKSKKKISTEIRDQIKIDLRKGKMSVAQIAFKHKTTRGVVRSCQRAIKKENGDD